MGSLNNADHPLSEFIQYSEVKQLAYNLASAQQQKMFHSLAVLSVYPGEGKSFFCAALALAYTELFGGKVLVVDTTTFHAKGSIDVHRSLLAASSLIDVRSMKELNDLALPTARSEKKLDDNNELPILEGEVSPLPSPHLLSIKENEVSLLQRVTLEGSKHYKLILVDTTPLSARNRGNLDPILAARLCDASILLVSKELLAAPDVEQRLKTLQDPSLRLLGVVANEEYA